ncbi:DUF262 domain-containing protein [Azospirillum sp. B4]|uniref:GmrSD restriction endonuclease domain-containing protein n=1 Tax=Azospirillum sp. B4 TaxID=95605 RepID=UPI000345FE04|nr:DUF262 domain-containing protein [Azospirillum sp. B4]
MMESLSIRDIVDMVTRGQLRIPAFQRGFVWDAERVSHLMDSIYKNYPFGSLMIWRTKEKLKFDRDLGPFKLPEPKEDYPVDYVLDGQQRLTSIFGVFQTTMKKTLPVEWTDIYFDLAAEATAQDSQFVALRDDEVIADRHFPLNTLFDSTAYRKATESYKGDVLKKIDDMQAVFKETKIPVQVSKTDDKATVAIIFERVNRQGVELDTLQLLSAWTWSEDFQLADKFEELADELKPFGFADIGGDTDLLLRCCSAILADDASPKALMELNGANVRANFEAVTNGVKYAVDYFRKNFKAQTLANLPFTTLLVPLAVFFASSNEKEISYTEEQKKIINRWFWRASFSKRYSSGVLRNLKADIAQMKNLRGGYPSTLGDFSFSIDDDHFLVNSFGMGNVNTKTFLLMLAAQDPVSFISGQPVDLEATLKAANRSEFHHMMPRDFLKKSGQNSINDNVLANICFLSRADNRKLGGVAPSVYRMLMPQDISAIIKSSLASDLLFEDKYEVFAKKRASDLANTAKKLCGLDV